MSVRLGVPLLASALLHAAVLLAAGPWTAPRDPAGTVLRVSLLPPSPVSRTPSRPAAGAPPPAAGARAPAVLTAAAGTMSLPAVHQGAMHPARAGTARDHAPPRPAPETPTPAGPPARAPALPAQAAAAPASVRAQALGRRLRRELTALLAPYFHYPWVARREGWQGEVRVRVRIEPDGRLSGIRLARTSGYPVLDNAALASLHRVHRLPQTLTEASGFDLNVPIVYRLTAD